jgi:DNA polymerase-1
MSRDGRLLVLVDGSSYLYRAFHALPDLRNAAGEPTGAIYGVLNMLRRLVTDYKADFLGCVFDAKGKTFRDEVYPEYKAHRPPMPDDLAGQIEPLMEAIRALGWPLLVVEGVEADDVIGTLAREASVRGIDTVVSTGDKDLAQLVDGHVTLINTMSNERLDPVAVEAKFGVPPEKIVDWLALVGDVVDNIPGVEKVGPKTAAKWIAEYGSLDGVLAHADAIKGVAGENLRKARDWLPMGRELVTVRRDLALPFGLDALRPGERDREKLQALFARFGFKSWLREVEGASGGEAPAAIAAPALPAADAPRRYETLLTESDLGRWLERVARADEVCVDTETTSLDPFAARLVGVSLSIEPGHAAYLAIDHRYPGAPDQLGVARAVELLRPWLEDPSRRKIGQNIKYDQHVLANHGIALAGVAHDTLLQSYVLESHARHDMDSLAERHLGLKTIGYDEVTGKGAQRIGFEEVSVERATEYSAEDADITLRLHRVLHPRVTADPKLRFVYESIEMPVREVLFRIERNGVLVDAGRLEAHGHELGQKMLELERKAHAEAGQPFNLNSPKQIGEIFFERLKLPVVKKTPSGAPSTDEEVLEKLALDYPLPKTLLEYRAVSKLKSTYTDKLPRMVNPRTGRVHTNYGQATAVTGRLASNDPNLQNIPVRTAEGRRIREAFVAPPGHLIVSADYSQVELRIMAHISEDRGLLDAFARGDDIHCATAAEIFGREPGEVTSEERRYAKTINFGLIYGMSAFGLAQQLGLERATAQAYIDSYFARYPGVQRYMEATRAAAREQGYVETVLGRRLWLPEIRSANQARRSGAERAAINAPMQGTAADLIKLAMIAVQGWIDTAGLGAKLVMQVHDELVLEVPEGELAPVQEELPKLMSGVAALRVPLVVDVGVGKNWDEAH